MSLIESLRGKKVLFVASTGGHLSELDRLAARIHASEDSLWVTFEKPQSVSMLANRRHQFIPYIAPRDFKAVLVGLASFRSILRNEKFDAVVSTGAAIALSSHLVATSKGVRSIFVESVARFDGPSMTGKILQMFSAIEMYCQNSGFNSTRWKQEFSVLDSYEVDGGWIAPNPPKKIFVTLGTIQPYRFDSLVDKLVAIAPVGTEFVWQLGASFREGLPGRSVAQMSTGEFQDALNDTDLVVTHAGVGSIMGLLDKRAPMLVVPRRKFRKEHIDDHQLQITREVGIRGLAVAEEVGALTFETLTRAAGMRVQ